MTTRTQFIENAIEQGYTQQEAESFLKERFATKAEQLGYNPEQAQEYFTLKPTTAVAESTKQPLRPEQPPSTEIKPYLNKVNKKVGEFNQAFNASIEGLLVGQEASTEPLMQFWEEQKQPENELQSFAVNVMRGVTSLPLIPPQIGEELLNADSPEAAARATTEMLNFPIKFGASLLTAASLNPVIEVARLTGSQKAEEIKRESQQLIFNYPVETLLAATMGRSMLRGGKAGIEEAARFKEYLRERRQAKKEPTLEDLSQETRQQLETLANRKEAEPYIEEWVKQAADEQINAVQASDVIPEAMKQKVTRFVTKQQKGERYTPPEPKTTPSDLAEEGAIFRMKPRGTSKEPSGGEGVFKEVARRSEIVKDLSEILDVPIRTGKFKQKAEGIYKQRPEVIRSRLANDIETISHEVGHHLHKQLLEPGAKKLSDKPFEPFRKELAPLATKPAKGQDVLPEGFAEFTRLYITERAKAQKQAPNFYEHFESILQDVPEVKSVLDKAKADYTRWLEQPATARVLSQISINEKPHRGIGIDDIYTMAKDDLYPLRQATRDLTKGEDIPFSKDPYKLARLSRGWWGKVDNFLEYGTREFGTGQILGKPLKEVLNPVRENMDNFRAYIVSKRALEKIEQGKETGIRREDAVATINELENPKFTEAFRDLKTYQDQTLQYLVDSEILKKDVAERIRTMNQDFVPFYRVVETENPMGQGKRFANLFNPVKRFKGSARDIIDPLESVVKNTYSFINIAERNRVSQALVELAEQRGGTGKYVERIPESQFPIEIKMEEILNQIDLKDVSKDISEQIATVFRPSLFTPKDEPIVTVFRQGERELYSVTPEIHRSLLAMDREGLSTLTKMLAKPARLLRAGATLSPGFMMRNPFRDNFSAYIQSNYGFKPGVDFVRGLFHAIKKDDLYWDFKQSGAEHSMLVSLDRQYLQQNIKDLMNERSLFIPEQMALRHPMEGLRMLSEFGETATRLGEFQRAMRQLQQEGVSYNEALAKGGFAAREVTLDFAKMGSKTQGWNAISAFFNAGLEAVNKMTQTFKDNPGRATAKAVSGITVPSILLYFVNRDDPRYQDMPAWRKDLFWNIPTENHYFSLPKPFTYGVLFGSFPERVLEYVDNQDPEVFSEWAETFYESLTIPLLPTAAVPLIENFANWNMYREQPIVPRGLQDVEPSEQYSGYTSQVAQKLGRALNYPPAKIDNLIQGWTAGLGRIATESIDEIMKQTGIVDLPPQPKRPLSSFPVFRSFIERYPQASTASMENFYDQYSRSQQAVRTFNLLKERQQIERARKYQQENITDLQLAKPLRGIANEFSKYRDLVKSIYQDENLSPEEKRKAIDEIYLILNQRAKQADEYIQTAKESP